MWTSLKRTLYGVSALDAGIRTQMILSLFKNQASHGSGKSVRMPLSCAYESFYFLSLILGLVSPTLLCIPYITENDCKINFMGIFKTIQEDFWSVVKSHTWNAQQAEYFSFHNDVVNFFSCLLISLFLKLCTYVTKSCFFRYPKGCEQPRGVYKVA